VVPGSKEDLRREDIKRGFSGFFCEGNTHMEAFWGEVDMALLAVTLFDVQMFVLFTTFMVAPLTSLLMGLDSGNMDWIWPLCEYEIDRLPTVLFRILLQSISSG
jgi:hypothetical protein